MFSIQSTVLILLFLEPQMLLVNRMERKNNKKQNKTFSFSLLLGKVLFVFTICVLIYVVLTPFFNLLLLNYGARTNAVVTQNETSWRHRYTSNNYEYEFLVGGKMYTGNSLINVENKDRIGDSVVILYLPCFPYYNRPMSYFDK